MPKLAIPTGYEAEQRKAASRRKMAEALLARALSGNGGQMTSWAQPIAQMAQAFAGKRMDAKADEMDADVSKRMREAYSTGMASIKADSEGGMSNADIVNKYGSDPLLQDAISPYKDAYAAGLKERENIVKFGGKLTRTGDVMGQQEPGDPNDAVIRDAQGNWVVNPVRTTAALRAQGFSAGGAGIPEVMSMPDPLAAQPPPGAASPSGGGDGLDLSLLSPEERDIMAKELQRRSSGGYNPDVSGVNTSIPSGSPLTARRQPAGQVNGKPYWIINGVAYDNPEGR